MAQEVTTGQELNSYQGNAALAGGSENIGYAKIDLSPLQDYALKRYEINAKDYETQQQDKKALEQQFMDPKLYVSVDEGLANQISPKLTRLKELMMMNLDKNPNSKQYFEFKSLYNDVLKDNAQAKVVQNLKDKYKEMAGSTPDEHEREKINSYIKQLDDYKLGSDIPVYNRYFAFNEDHLPSPLEGNQPSKFVGKRVKGNEIQDVEFSIFNPLDLDKIAVDQRMRNPQVYNTGEDIGHTLLSHGGIDLLNEAAKDAYDKGLRYNIEATRKKYDAEFKNFLKNNPNATFKQFMDSTGRGDELKKIYSGLQYLKNGVQYIPSSVDGGGKIDNFSYSPDGNLRLSVDNDTLRALYAATRKPIGESEKVVKSEISKVPSEIELNKQKIETEKGKLPELKARANAANALAEMRRANKKFVDKKSSALDETINPVQTFDEIFKGKMKTEYTDFNGGNYVTRVNREAMPKSFLDNLGIDPVNQKGDYNIVPANIKFNGKTLLEADAHKMYMDWMKTKDAKDFEDQIEHRPSIFDFMFAKGVDFETEVEGRIPPVYKQVKQADGTYKNEIQNTDAGKFIRSNRLTSWINQRKQLGAKGDKLIMSEGAPEDNADMGSNDNIIE